MFFNCSLFVLKEYSRSYMHVCIFLHMSKITMHHCTISVPLSVTRCFYHPQGYDKHEPECNLHDRASSQSHSLPGSCCVSRRQTKDAHRHLWPSPQSHTQAGGADWWNCTDPPGSQGNGNLCNISVVAMNEDRTRCPLY